MIDGIAEAHRLEGLAFRVRQWIAPLLEIATEAESTARRLKTQRRAEMVTPEPKEG